jgi:FMN-dependent oxidoreductase (nitrilotriacetate monooxygenase family)
MAKRDGQMRLGVFLQGSGHHLAGAWRLPESPSYAGLSFDHFRRCAEISEAGKLDMVFVADFAAITDADLNSKGYNGHAVHLESVTLLSALVPVTRRIGLVGTMTATYNEPYHIARQFASLDQMSGGRAGWNLVTSSRAEEALNFGLERHPAQSERYARAHELAGIVTGLWDGWEPDALLGDKQTGQYYDPAKLHLLNHSGERFAVRGPLTIPPSPQGRPIIVQAGSSEEGVGLAAAASDVIFTAQNNITDARTFYAKAKDEAMRHGRKPDDLKIMPGFAFIIGRTREEADAKFARLQSFITPQVAINGLSRSLGGLDLSRYDLDGPVPELDSSATNAQRGRFQLLIDKARRDNLTIRQLAMWFAGTKGHSLTVGTASDVVDVMEQWFDEGAADGFNLMPSYLPGGLEDFVALALPELRRRGLFRTEYEGRTLRENLGLSPHANRYSARRLTAESLS